MANRVSFKDRWGLRHFNAFDFLLVCVWGRGILLYYSRTLVSRLPIVGSFSEYFISTVFVLGVLFSLPYLFKKINKRDILFYLIIVCYYFSNYYLHPSNSKVLSDYSEIFLLGSLPVFFVGLSINIKKSYNLLRLVSLLSIIILAVILFVLGGTEIYEIEGEEGESQVLAYSLLPCVIFTTWACLESFCLIDFIGLLIGVFELLSLGTRGPIVCLLFFILIYLLCYKHYKNKALSNLFIIIMGIVAYMTIEPMMIAMSVLFPNLGVSSRLSSLFFENALQESTGRDDIAQQIWSYITRDIFTGHGLGGDRVLVGSWSHNFALEVFMTFGLIFGLVLLIVLVYLLVRCFIKEATSINARFLLLLICCSIIKLMISSSFLQESMLFFLFGYIVNLLRSGSATNTKLNEVVYK